MRSKLCLYILASATIALGNTIFLPKAIAQTPTNPTPNIFSTPNNSDPNPLAGQWEVKDPVTGDILRLIFAPEGKLYTLVIPAGSSSNSQLPTLALSYQINVRANPQEIDIISPNNGKGISTIWELTKDGKLRIDLGQGQPGSPRPTSFSPSAVILDKVAVAAELPANAQIYNPNASNVPSVKADIERVNRAQILYFLEYNRFANSMEQLGLKMPPSVEDYVYQLEVNANKTGMAIFTAKAKKPNLNSYLGAVFEYKSKEREKTIGSIICETDSPSQTLPSQPTLAENFTVPIRCATGSHPTQP